MRSWRSLREFLEWAGLGHVRVKYAGDREVANEAIIALRVIDWDGSGYGVVLRQGVTAEHARRAVRVLVMTKVVGEEWWPYA